jgi:nitroimidazol reductase NimA-like FMN-containing flavoprotein (pyridoxamine 5'-phosphate oxidase superfamily)
VTAQLSPEDVVRKFFDCYTNGRPEDFDEVVAPDYLDYGHTPPGRGPGGARDDYENAVKQAGAVIGYTIDALIADGEMVAVVWTGTLPGGAEIGKGLSLYRTSGGLLRSTRHADPSSPGGSASPGAGVSSRRVVEQLDEAACLELLSAGRIGRLIYTSRYGPVALPSEYKLHDGSIVFRTYRVTFTEEDLRTGIAQAEYQVVVEVDQVDPQAHEGWVVLVRGTAHHVDTEAERASISNVGLQSWVEAEPEHFIRVVPISIAGQRLRSA